MNYNERYEQLAQKFYDKYGFYPPGKDTYDAKPDDAFELWIAFLAKEKNGERVKTKTKRKEIK